MNDELKIRIAALSRPRQVAFAAACAERTLPAYGLRGDHAEVLADAIRTAWAFVTGTEISRSLATKVLHGAIDAAPPSDADDTWSQASRAAVDATCAAIEAIYADDDVASRAAEALINTAEILGGLPAVATERAFVALAIGIAETDELVRGMFAGAAENPPEWLRSEASGELPLLSRVDFER